MSYESRSIRGPHVIGPNIGQASPQKHAYGPADHRDEGCWRLYGHIIACLPNKRMLCNAIRRREVLSPGKATSDACGKRPRTLHMLICVADMHLMRGRPTACADGHQHVPSCQQLAYCYAPPVAMRCYMSKPKPKLTAENLRRLTSLRCPDSVRTQHRQIRRR